VPSLFLHLQQFMATGGPALWAILAAAAALWTLAIERYLYFRTRHAAVEKESVTRWKAREDRTSWYAKQIRRMEIAQMSDRVRRTLPLIRTLTVLLPILGLLGTVNGMIFTFTVMEVYGTGNANGMAGGISGALVTTMAGLVCALPGLYFSFYLDYRAEEAVRRLTLRLQVE